jgi:hypothetical protein
MPSFLPDHIRRGANRARSESEELTMRFELKPASNELDRRELVRFAVSFCRFVLPFRFALMSPATLASGSRALFGAAALTCIASFPTTQSAYR